MLSDVGARTARQNFQSWMGEVNDLCFFSFGMSIYDLPDLPFYDSYDSGESPEAFMEDVLPDLAALGSLILS